MKISKELKIGLLALISGAALYLGFNFLKGSDFFSRTNHFYAIFPEVGGLTVSNPVTINGLQIGRVKNIEILQNNNNKMLVTIALRRDIVIGKNASVKLGAVDLLSGKQLMLAVGTTYPIDSPKNMQSGDTITNATLDEDIMAKVTKQIEPITQKVDSTLLYINGLLKELSGAGNKVKAVLDDASNLTASLDNTLKRQGGNIDAIMGNLRNLSSSLVETEKSFKPILKKVDDIAGQASKLELDKTLANTNKTVTELNKVLETINQGQGTLGNLIKNDTLYTNLEKLTTNLDKLLTDFRENPKRYVHFSVFGKKDKKKKK
ncbi:MAG TPA: MCE family protein [Microscillaceae bacterium]|nr:MCE family protein [Microscillaceae bacterium]